MIMLYGFTYGSTVVLLVKAVRVCSFLMMHVAHERFVPLTAHVHVALRSVEPMSRSPTVARERTQALRRPMRQPLAAQLDPHEPGLSRSAFRFTAWSAIH